MPCSLLTEMEPFIISTIFFVMAMPRPVPWMPLMVVMHLEEAPTNLPDILHGLRSIIQSDIHAKQLELYIGSSYRQYFS